MLHLSLLLIDKLSETESGSFVSRAMLSLLKNLCILFIGYGSCSYIVIVVVLSFTAKITNLFATA